MSQTAYYFRAKMKDAVILYTNPLAKEERQ